MYSCKNFFNISRNDLILYLLNYNNKLSSSPFITDLLSINLLFIYHPIKNKILLNFFFTKRAYSMLVLDIYRVFRVIKSEKGQHHKKDIKEINIAQNKEIDLIKILAPQT
tara:strand:- start:5884 stop:6213 length:330 start_codon:yes stop_codon:yes gene_type:complete